MNRAVVLPLLAAAFAAACRATERSDHAASESASSRAETLWLLPGSGTEAVVDARTSERDLIARFGSPAVTREDVQVGEGETRPATVLFAGDSLRRLEIIWRDSSSPAQPSIVRLYGGRSSWRVGPGVTLGMSLAELEQVNRRPFSLTGFHWDYAGTVTSWRGGALDSLPRGATRLLARFRPSSSAEAASAAEASTVVGDREFPSNHPAMRRLDPRIYALEVWFDRTP